ncbi:MAG: hypothetical protein LBH27_02900 [Endomicrobium sp.]|nr:hypothetical protein [Endomicrobium sp.]
MRKKMLISILMFCFTTPILAKEQRANTITNDINCIKTEELQGKSLIHTENMCVAGRLILTMLVSGCITYLTGLLSTYIINKTISKPFSITSNK